jgi:hypothetical protein
LKRTKIEEEIAKNQSSAKERANTSTNSLTPFRTLATQRFLAMTLPFIIGSANCRIGKRDWKNYDGQAMERLRSWLTLQNFSTMLVLLKTQRRINGRNVFPTTGLL